MKMDRSIIAVNIRGKIREELGCLETETLPEDTHFIHDLDITDEELDTLNGSIEEEYKITIRSIPATIEELIDEVVRQLTIKEDIEVMESNREREG
jgi:hypothetical protein